MNNDELRQWSKRAADWTHGYYNTLRERPVRAQTRPGATALKLAKSAPQNPEPMEQIFADFEAIVPGAMTHWQHPRFFGYFPANAAPASILAEQLTAALAAQAMLWQTAPAANEIEEVMINWLRDALGLATHFTGTIHDSATTATLTAVLTMRERALNWKGNEQGLSDLGNLRIYASDQTHFSIDKSVRIAGIGQQNLCRIQTDSTLSMRPETLDEAIKLDKSNNHLPAGVILCVGGTSVGACDRIAELIEVARSHDLYTHVDAAWAGSAMICPELRTHWEGVDGADSIVFNPHKWLGAQFDCSVQFLADPDPQIRTLALRPDYMQTSEQSDVTNYNEWTVPLGRRFRALKIWFLLRAYGLEGLRNRIRNHISWSRELCAKIQALPGIEIVTHPVLSLFTFACSTDARTQDLLQRVNDDGRVYLTQTRHNGRFVIRVQVGQFDCTRNDVMVVLDVLKDLVEN